MQGFSGGRVFSSPRFPGGVKAPEPGPRPGGIRPRNRPRRPRFCSVLSKSWELAGIQYPPREKLKTGQFTGVFELFGKWAKVGTGDFELRSSRVPAKITETEGLFRNPSHRRRVTETISVCSPVPTSEKRVNSNRRRLSCKGLRRCSLVPTYLRVFPMGAAMPFAAPDALLHLFRRAAIRRRPPRRSRPAPRGRSPYPP